MKEQLPWPVFSRREGKGAKGNRLNKQGATPSQSDRTTGTRESHCLQDPESESLHYSPCQILL